MDFPHPRHQCFGGSLPHTGSDGYEAEERLVTHFAVAAAFVPDAVMVCIGGTRGEGSVLPFLAMRGTGRISFLLLLSSSVGGTLAHVSNHWCIHSRTCSGLSVSRSRIIRCSRVER